jgi:hypothetical protein
LERSWDQDGVIKCVYEGTGLCRAGYHIYKDRQEPFIGGALDCERKTSNPHDLFSKAVIHDEKGIVGHLSQAISQACSSFIDKRAVFKCAIAKYKQGWYRVKVKRILGESM